MVEKRVEHFSTVRVDEYVTFQITVYLLHLASTTIVVYHGSN